MRELIQSVLRSFVDELILWNEPEIFKISRKKYMIISLMLMGDREYQKRRNSATQHQPPAIGDNWRLSEPLTSEKIHRSFMFF